MAKASITGLTESACREHILKSGYRNELSCPKILGFHLQKLKTGGCWRFRYHDFDGKKRILNLGKYTGDTSNRLDAAEKAIEYRNQVNRGEDPASEKKAKQEALRQADARRQNGKLGTYLDGIYTLHQSRKSGGKHTLDLIRRHFSQWLDTPMELISVADLKQWQYQSEQEGFSHSTIKRAFGAFRTMLRHAVREHILNDDPSAKFQLAPPTAAEKNKAHEGEELKARRMLTILELQSISKGIELYKAQLIQQRENSRNHGKLHLPSLERLTFPHWFFPFFHLAAYTGMRSGDLYTLNWQELNTQFKRLVKVPNKTRHHHDPIKVDLPLDDRITNLMTQWREQCGNPASGLVFPSEKTGKRLDRQAHNTHWKKVLALGGIEADLDFYSLRHHFISRMVAGGFPLFTVARLSGHKSVKMIEQHYGHLAPHAAADALALVANDYHKHTVFKDKKWL
ncbi:tyrosine-type recombinase/integrase [Marinomonas sp. GJ51-6]|uniref:tyrosine-type recombinase/integrase n=1 Tax=Marinomonas sp. GJ51-6 TaxID=2992802 RepID=UPI002934CA90|nr:tyrosine-type recombinase/integrase [Marinomonas sp. GJ51-6]WOD08094.1 tyrosine-type recombinase/integrase [Marinomonas sp. GJ51-6]